MGLIVEQALIDPKNGRIKNELHYKNEVLMTVLDKQKQLIRFALATSPIHQLCYL